jgi:hypothetical protein
MSELSTTTLPPPVGGGRFPFLIGILLVANLAVISNVRMGSVYLNQLKSVLLPQNENSNMPMDDVRALVKEVVDTAIQTTRMIKVPRTNKDLTKRSRAKPRLKNNLSKTKKRIMSTRKTNKKWKMSHQLKNQNQTKHLLQNNPRMKK